MTRQHDYDTRPVVLESIEMGVAELIARAERFRERIRKLKALLPGTDGSEPELRDDVLTIENQVLSIQADVHALRDESQVALP